LAPPFDVLFRPEEEHGSSSEDDVVPPVGGRNGEMHDPICVREAASADRESDTLSTIRAGCYDSAILGDHSEDAEGVPDAIPPPMHEPRGNSKGCRHGRKRVGHEDFAAFWLKNKHVGLGEPAEGCGDICLWQGKPRGNLRSGK